MAPPLEDWLRQHDADRDQLRYAPSFRNRHETAALWARLIGESDTLEFVPALVPVPGDPAGLWRAVGAHPE